MYMAVKGSTWPLLEGHHVMYSLKGCNCHIHVHVNIHPIIYGPAESNTSFSFWPLSWIRHDDPVHACIG